MTFAITSLIQADTRAVSTPELGQSTHGCLLQQTTVRTVTGRSQNRKQISINVNQIK